MSRAFTKEDDAGEDLPERPIPPGPNYVTPRGLEMLKAAGRELVDRRKKAAAAGGDLLPIDRDLRYLEARIGSAVVVPPGSGEEIRFGARVTVEDDSGERKTLQIVGDDEARTGEGLLSWSAPLALAMIGARPGETVTWEGEEASLRYRIVAVEYPR
jgi:transcription elongation GreA/GreB family factor